MQNYKLLIRVIQNKRALIMTFEQKVIKETKIIKMEKSQFSRVKRRNLPK